MKPFLLFSWTLVPSTNINSSIIALLPDVFHFKSILVRSVVKKNPVIFLLFYPHGKLAKNTWKTLVLSSSRINKMFYLFISDIGGRAFIMPFCVLWDDSYVYVFFCWDCMWLMPLRNFVWPIFFFNLTMYYFPHNLYMLHLAVHNTM